MRALIVRLSSMGDLVHTLPAVSDAVTNVPDIQFDWVVDHAFADIPRMHPAVNEIILSAHRKWRKQWFSYRTHQQIYGFLKTLRKKQYDYIIDAQSSLKSAVVTRMGRGRRYGLSRQTVSEYGAHWFYQQRFSVTRDQHHCAHLRSLFAKIFDYVIPNAEPNFSLDIGCLPAPAIQLPEKFLIFITNASWESKCWPERYWLTLIQKVSEVGYSVLLPWGNEREQKYVTHLASLSENSIVLPKLNLLQIAKIMACSHGVIGNDTGLSHLGAALNVPTVALFGPTNPRLTGTLGQHNLNLSAKFNCAPCYKKTCHFKAPSVEKSACFTTLLPGFVWEQFQQLLASKELICESSV